MSSDSLNVIGKQAAGFSTAPALRHGADAVIDPEWSFAIMTDGYSGYNALSRMPGIKWHAACWAHHAWRKFVEAAAGRKNQAAAHQMVTAKA